MSQPTISLETVMQLLKEAYEKKDYKKVFSFGTKVLEQDPQNFEVKEMVQEAETFLAAKGEKLDRKLSLGSLIVASLLIVGGIFQFFFINPSYQSKIDAQEKKLLEVIQENGSIQSVTNDVLSNMTLVKGQISMVANAFQIFQDKMNRKRGTTSAENEKMIAGLQEKIAEQNNQIQKLAQLSVSQSVHSSASNYGNNIINFLVLGENGGLTDTILIASVNTSLKTISLLSIPRDLYVEGRKINEVYEKFGVETLLVYLHDITGLNIQQYVRFDFEGFKKIIDMVGGIDVEVAKDIEDKKYPVGDGTVETFVIRAGWQHLDGTTALQYARTRHDDSDFERAKRQQQIIDATIGKVRALGITDIAKMVEMAVTAFSYAQSDVNAFQGLGFYQSYKDFRIKQGNVLSTANYLTSSKTLTGQYILLPNDRTYEEIQKWVYGIVEEGK